MPPIAYALASDTAIGVSLGFVIWEASISAGQPPIHCVRHVSWTAGWPGAPGVSGG